jgi:type I restriction enzyme S subunit
VLFGKRRAYQRKVAVPDFNGICSGDILVFEVTGDEMLQEYMPYVVQSDGFFEHALDTSAGSLSPRTKWQELAKYEFALPPIDEQQRISTLMKEIDAASKAMDSVLKMADRLVGAILEDVVRQPSIIWKPLSELLEMPLSNGITIEPTSDPTGYWSMTIGSIGEWGFVKDGIKPIRKPPHTEKSSVMPGDLFVTRSNTLDRVGLPAHYPGLDLENLSYSDLLIRVRPIERIVSSQFLEHYLRSVRARTFIRSIAAGTSASMKKINGANLKKLPVPLLGRRLLDEVMSKLDAVERFRLGCLDQRESLKLVRTSVLGNLLQGGEVVH